MRDLAFNPGAPDQLWTYNTLIHGTVIFFAPGTAEQSSEVRVDAYGQHFMAYVHPPPPGASWASRSARRRPLVRRRRRRPGRPRRPLVDATADACICADLDLDASKRDPHHRSRSRPGARAAN